MYGWASGAGAGLDVIYQMLGNLADGRHIGAVIVAAAVGFLQQQSGVIQAVKVPEHGAGIQVQLLGQLLAAHGPLHHQPPIFHRWLMLIILRNPPASEKEGTDWDLPQQPALVSKFYCDT